MIKNPFLIMFKYVMNVLNYYKIMFFITLNYPYEIKDQKQMIIIIFLVKDVFLFIYFTKYKFRIIINLLYFIRKFIFD